MIVRELLTRWGVKVDAAALKRFDDKIMQTKQNLNKLGDRSTQLGKSLTLFATAPILGLGGALVKAASDAEETSAKFGTVFSGIAEKATSAADRLDKSFGLSSTQAKELLGNTGDLLTGFGFTQDKALELSQGVQELAVDLASFTNFSGGAKGASAALTKALLGERESAKSLGIVINEELVKAKIKDLKASGKLKGASEQQAKAEATLQIALAQSKNAIGDYARTSDGFANSFRDFKSEVADLAVEFGEILLPIVKDLLNNYLKPAVRYFRSLSKGVKTTILVVAGLVAALGPLLLIFGLMANGLASVIGGFRALAFFIPKLIAMVASLNFALIGTVALWVGVFSIIFLIFEDLLAFAQGRKSVARLLMEKFGEALDYIGEKFKGLSKVVKVFVAAVTTPIRLLINLVQGLGGAIGAIVGGDFSLAGKALLEQGKKLIPDLDDFGSFLGFGSDERLRPKGAPQAGGGGANVQVTNKITVPEGTPQSLVGDAVEKGVAKSMDRALRRSGEVFQPQFAE